MKYTILLLWWFIWLIPGGTVTPNYPVIVGPFLNVMDCNKIAVGLPRQRGDWVSECWSDGKVGR